MTKKIAIYGKSGVGKTTIAANFAAALARAGKLIVVILPDSGERYITTQLSEQGE
jgi:nitrogenase subunit NifH